ncbi:hypothetical protein D3C81_1816090 [compost metagenome]
MTRAGIENFAPGLYGSRHIKGHDIVIFTRSGKGQRVGAIVNFSTAKRHHHRIGLAQ